jgi:hypothetical protein
MEMAAEYGTIREGTISTETCVVGKGIRARIALVGVGSR